MSDDEKFIARARGLFTFDEEGDCVGSPGFLQIAKALAAAEREGEVKARAEAQEMAKADMEAAMGEIDELRRELTRLG